MTNVALSVGHGKTTINGQKTDDPGAVYYGIEEHRVCQDIVDMVRILCADFGGVHVYPVTVGTLEEKVNQINRLNFDYAIEIHLNAFENPDTTGSEVLYQGGSKTEQRLAEHYASYLSGVLHTRNRGVKGVNKYFLRETNCPAIITEAEFLSNPQIAEGLTKGFLRQCIAFAHAKAIVSTA